MSLNSVKPPTTRSTPIPITRIADHFTLLQPIPLTQLEEIAQNICESTFTSVHSYKHAETTTWNTSIITSTLQSILSALPSTTPPSPPTYKFIVTSTIIQHAPPPTPVPPPAIPEGGSTAYDSAAENTSPRRVEQRGMHAASGAYYNEERDGMWSWKWEDGPARGLDVVISVVWIGC